VEVEVGEGERKRKARGRFVSQAKKVSLTFLPTRFFLLRFLRFEVRFLLLFFASLVSGVGPLLLGRQG
jgi:hypothetical protein